MATNDLWGSDEDTLVDVKAEKVGKAAVKKGIFDFDDDDDTIVDISTLKSAHNSKKVLNENKTNKTSKSLFDESEEDETNVENMKKPSTQTTLTKHNDTKHNNGLSSKDNYYLLYLTEQAKATELEQMVTSLQQRVVQLESQLQSLNIEVWPSNHFAPVSTTIGDHGAQDSVTSPSELFETQPGKPIDNWEKLANEEKERRQRSRTIKNKPRPVSTSVKRLNALSIGKLQTDNHSAESAASPLQPAPNAVAQTIGDQVSATNGVSGRVTQSVAWDASSDSDSGEINSTSTHQLNSEATSAFVGDAAASREADATTAEEKKELSHWSELAALDKERKAAARKRVVRGNQRDLRPKSLKAAVLSTATASSTTTNSAGGSNSNSAKLSPSPVPGASAASRTDVLHSDDSSWDSQDSEESDSAEDAAAVKSQQVSSEATAMPTTTRSNSEKSTAAIIPTAQQIREKSDLELAIDTKLLEWVRSCRNDAAALLRSVHTVKTGLPDLSDMWRGDSSHSDDPALVRKAYLKIVRACHPDKHMHLDPSSREFIETGRVFTIISDSYNKYKAMHGL